MPMKYLTLQLLSIIIATCLNASEVISVNQKTFKYPQTDGFMQIHGREKIIEAVPIVERDYRHITHLILVEDGEGENPAIGRFTTPTKSVGARIKKRKEFIAEIVQYQYDQEEAEKLKAVFEEVKEIVESSNDDISIESINEGLMTPKIVDYDDYGIYLAQTMKGFEAGKPFTKANVITSTVVNGTVFNLYISKNFESLATHQELLTASKALTAQFVQLNEAK